MLRPFLFVLCASLLHAKPNLLPITGLSGVAFCIPADVKAVSLAGLAGLGIKDALQQCSPNL